MGLGAAIGAGAGLLMGGKATSSQTTGQQQSQQQSAQGSSQQSNSGPWVGAQPGLATLYSGAIDNFYGGGPQYYPGQTVADQSWTTQHGLNMGQQAGLLGTQNMGGAATLDSAQNLANATNNGGYLYSNPAQAGYVQGSHFDANNMAGMNALGALGAGSGLGRTQGMGGLGSFGAGGNVGQTAGDNQLESVANGSMLNANPYVDQMFSQAAGQVGQNYAKNVMPGVASMFAGAGRYGSEAMNQGMDNAQQQYGNQINQLASSIYGGNYASERGLQQGAMNQLNNAGLQERQQQLGALGTLGGLSQGEQQQRLSALMGQTGNQLQGQGLQLNALNGLSGAYQNERGLQNASMGMAPGLAQADYTDVNALLGAGAQRDAYQQQGLNAAQQRWDFGQNANNNRLAFLNSIMSGAPQASSSIGSSYGTSSGNSSETKMLPGNPMAPMQGMMMGGILGQGIGSMF